MQICKEKYFCGGRGYQITWKWENFGYLSIKSSNFCGFVRSNIFVFDQNIVQFMFEKKNIYRFHTFQRWGVWTKSVKIHTYFFFFFDWELPLAFWPTYDNYYYYDNLVEIFDLPPLRNLRQISETFGPLHRQ